MLRVEITVIVMIPLSSLFHSEPGRETRSDRSRALIRCLRTYHNDHATENVQFPGQYQGDTADNY